MLIDYLTASSILYTFILLLIYFYIIAKIIQYVFKNVFFHCKCCKINKKKYYDKNNTKEVKDIEYTYSYIEEEDIPLLENSDAFQSFSVTTSLQSSLKYPRSKKNNRKRSLSSTSQSINKNTYWLSRMLIIRTLGFVYSAAFLIVALQGRPLIGVDGLTPVPLLSEPKNLPIQGWFFTIFGWNNRVLECLGWVGFILSLLLCSGRISNPIIAFILWALYESFYYASHLPGVRFFHYGWDFQLLETGFLTIFLCPITSNIFNTCRTNSYFYRSSPKDNSNSTPLIVLWLFRWLGFRVMLGAGLSKIMSSEPCWKYSKLNCMAFFYETTGNPSPLAWLLHKSPLQIHYLEVLANHFVELVLPWLFLSPWRTPRHFAGVIQISFQIVLILGGNYAFLNHLTIVPCLALFDDAFILKYTEMLFPSSILVAFYKHKIMKLQESNDNDAGEEKDASLEVEDAKKRKTRNARFYFIQITSFIKKILVPIILAIFILWKSKPALKNLFGPHPWLYTFDDFAFVNSYGVFGSITKKRYDMTLQYTHDPLPMILQLQHNDVSVNKKVTWKELPFRCKADVLNKWPCVTTPYYHRLDWETWIDVTAIGEYERKKKTPEYIITLIGKIFQGDKDAASLLRLPLSELYTGKDENVAPTAIMPTFYLYEYSNVSDLFYHGNWWKQKQTVQRGSLFIKQFFKNVHKSKNIDEISPARDWALIFLSISVTISYIETFLLNEDDGEQCIWTKIEDKIRINLALSAALLLSYVPNYTCSACSAIFCLYCAYKYCMKIYHDIQLHGSLNVYRHTSLFILLILVVISIYKNIDDFDARDYD